MICFWIHKLITDRCPSITSTPNNIMQNRVPYACFNMGGRFVNIPIYKHSRQDNKRNTWRNVVTSYFKELCRTHGTGIVFAPNHSLSSSSISPIVCRLHVFETLPIILTMYKTIRYLWIWHILVGLVIQGVLWNPLVVQNLGCFVRRHEFVEISQRPILIECSS